MNPIAPRKTVPAVLIYPERDGQILMLHRNGAKPDDYHEGKWNGLGGKCELDESALETAVRELAEESGLKLEASAFQPMGVIQFPNFKAHKNEDWLVFVFTATVPAGVQPWSRGPEGDLKWINREAVMDLQLWPGDRHFLPRVLNHEPIMGTIWYEGERVIRHWIQGFHPYH